MKTFLHAQFKNALSILAIFENLLLVLKIYNLGYVHYSFSTQYVQRKFWNIATVNNSSITDI